MLADRLNKELPDLESKHAKELSVFQTQLAHYKKTVEALKLELMNHAEAQKIAQSEFQLYKSKLDEVRFEAENEQRMQSLQFQKEKELLNEQIRLHKIQLEDITSKHITTMSILESKESIERSLEQALSNAAVLKQENDVLKFKLDDLSCRYSAAQSMIENSQMHERTLSGRVVELERSLTRFDATSVSTVSELGDTMYKTFDEEDVKKQLIKQKLEEKTEMEKLLIEKIHVLEDDLFKAKAELEQADFAKEAYEKQLKDMKNMCDKLQQEAASVNASIQRHSESLNIESNSVQKIKEQQKEIESLKLLVEQKETENASCKKDLIEMTEKTKKLEAQCEQLKDGLAQAWAQCAEFEEKLNQSIAMSESSKINVSLNSTTSSKLKTNESWDDSASDQNSMYKKKAVQSNNSYVKNDSENLYKELQQIMEGESSLDEVKFKLHRYYTLCEKMATEKAQLLVGTVISQQQQQQQQETKDSLRSSNSLRMEKELLSQRIENIVSRYKDELESVKADSAKEIKRLHILLQNIKVNYYFIFA